MCNGYFVKRINSALTNSDIERNNLEESKDVPLVFHLKGLFTALNLCNCDFISSFLPHLTCEGLLTFYFKLIQMCLDLI